MTSISWNGLNSAVKTIRRDMSSSEAFATATAAMSEAFRSSACAFCVLEHEQPSRTVSPAINPVNTYTKHRRFDSIIPGHSELRSHLVHQGRLAQPTLEIVCERPPRSLRLRLPLT